MILAALNMVACFLGCVHLGLPPFLGRLGRSGDVLVDVVARSWMAADGGGPIGCVEPGIVDGPLGLPALATIARSNATPERFAATVLTPFGTSNVDSSKRLAGRGRIAGAATSIVFQIVLGAGLSALVIVRTSHPGCVVALAELFPRAAAVFPVFELDLVEAAGERPVFQHAPLGFAEV